VIYRFWLGLTFPCVFFGFEKLFQLRLIYVYMFFGLMMVEKEGWMLNSRMKEWALSIE